MDRKEEIKIALFDIGVEFNALQKQASDLNAKKLELEKELKELG